MDLTGIVKELDTKLRAQGIHVQKRLLRKILNFTFEIIVDTTASGEMVRIRKFGDLVPKLREYLVPQREPPDNKFLTMTVYLQRSKVWKRKTKRFAREREKTDGN